MTAVNDAPVLTPIAPAFTTITEDQTNDSGQSVASIVGGSIGDVDSGAVEGIAITATADGTGTWQYSTNGGSSWSAVGAVGNGSALLLRSTDFVRFVPNGQSATSGSITYRAWDQTSGAAGSKVDTSVNNGTSAFSSALDTASISATAVNDAPVLSAIAPTLTTIDEDQTGNGGQTVASIVGASIADPDGAGLPYGLAITSINSGNASWQYSTDGGTNWQTVSGISGSNALLLRSTDLVRYLPNGQTGTSASFGYRAWDQTTGIAGTQVDASSAGGSAAFSSGTDIASITVDDVNDAPVLVPFAPALTAIDEDAVNNAGQSVASLLGSAVTDVDGDTNPGIAIVATTGNGTWQYALSPNNWVDVGTVSVSAALGLEDFDALRFVPSGNDGGTASITYRAWDRTTPGAAIGDYLDTTVSGGSTGFSVATDTATLTITAVNDAPVLTPIAPTLTAITEDQPNSAGQTVASFMGTSVTDPDAGALVPGIAVTAASVDQGHWQFSLDNGTSWSDVGSVDATAALLLRGSDKVRFVPDGSVGVTATLDYRAWDRTAGTAGSTVDVSNAGGSTAYSSTGDIATLSVTDVNDAPVFVSGGSPLNTITEDDLNNPGQTVGSFLGANATDVDAGTDIGIAVVDLDPGDGTWQFSLDGGTSWQAIGTVSDTSALLLRSTDFVRLVPNGELGSTSGAIVYRAWDRSTGSAGSKADASAVGGTSAFSASTVNSPIAVDDVNDAPVMVPHAPSMTAIGEDDLSSAGDTVASLLGSSVSDVDGDTNPGIAIFATTGNGTWQYSIGPNNWTAVGVVGDGAALVLQDTDLLRFVPNGANGGSASISYRAWDRTTLGVAIGDKVDTAVTGGSTGFSTATDTATLAVADVNDAPVLTPSTPVLTSITENDVGNTGQTVASFAGSSIADVDTGALAGIALTDTDPGNGTWQYSLDGGSTWSGVATVSDSSALLLRASDRVRFVPDGNNATTGSITYRGWDRTSGSAGSKVDVSSNGGATAFSSASDAASITVNAVNDAPTIVSDGAGATAALSIAENQTAVTTVASSDVDLPAQTLTYSIAGGADAGLFAIDAVTGALSFATAPDYESPTDAGANNVYDVIVQVSDGSLTDTQAIAITVTSVNDNAPAITSDGGGASATRNVAENTTAVTTVAATDADLPSQTLTYSISGGADAARFTIDSVTGALSFVAAPDYENPSDVGANNVYDVVVQASDGTFSDTQAIAVTVTPVNESAPVITSNGAGTTASVNVVENTSSVTTVVATDVDLPAGAITYSIAGGADAARFAIDASTGVLSFVAAPDYESPTDAGANNVYDVVVQASDGSLTDTQAIAVSVIAVNDNAPVIGSNGGGASAAVNVAENTSAVTTVVATDADLPAATITYSIAGGADASRFTIDANTGALSFVTAPDYESPIDAGANNVYDVIVKASDGALTDTQAIAVTVTPVNESTPVITSDGGGASATRTVAENTTAVTTVTAVDADLPSQTLTYSISGGADAARFTIDANTGALSFVAAPDYESPSDAGANNVYDVIVQASDGSLSVTQAIAVTVTPVNESAPAITSNGAGATASVNVAENSSSVTTVAATDGDLPAGVIAYSIAGGADAARFSIDASTGVLSFVAAPDYESPTDAGANNVYDVVVQASDGSLADTQAIAVTVTAVNDNAPVIISNGGGASAALSVAENTTAVTTVAATDADLPAATLAYTIAGGADASKFAIDTITGALTFVTAPDYESPTNAGGNNVYDVIVQASDGSSIDTQTIAVTVTPVNDNAPVITSDGGGANATRNVAENTTAVTTVTATDADLPAQTLIYSISGGADAARFTIDATTGALSFVVAPDYESPSDVGANNVYDVIVSASDGSLADTQAIAITVAPVNENAPVITSNGAGATASVDVVENATSVTTVVGADADLPAGALTYSIAGGADAARFSIDASTGVLSFVAAPDYESPSDAGTNNVYDVVVSASDGSLTDTQAIAVSVTAVNDNAPVITSNGGGASAAVNVAENASAVTTIVATDADLPAATLAYSIAAGADATRFTIDANSGALSFVTAPDYENPTDAGANNVYDVIVQASDGTLIDTQAIAISVTPVNDNAPVITSNGGGVNASVAVAEGATAVTTVVAADADLPASALTYSIVGGADAGRFVVDASTGVLSFVVAPDYELSGDANADNVYDVVVRASDGVAFATQTLAVSVANVNEPPAIVSNGGGASAATSIAENTVDVTTVAAVDADGPAQTLTYSVVGGVDAARFVIDGTTGTLRFGTAPDAEHPADAGADNVYDVVVQASDGSAIDTQALSIIVTDVNDNAPVITSNGGGTSATTRVTASSTAVTTVTAVDSDRSASTLIFSIAGGADAAKFRLDSSTRALVFVDPPAYAEPPASNVYQVMVQVSDGVYTTTQQLDINVMPPPTPIAPTPAPVVVPSEPASPPAVPAEAPVAAAPRASAPTTAPSIPIDPRMPMSQTARAAAREHDIGLAPLHVQAVELKPFTGAMLGFSAPLHSTVARNTSELKLPVLVDFFPTLPEARSAGERAEREIEVSWPAEPEVQHEFGNIETAALGGLAISFGVLFWASRSGAVLASLLISAPAWRSYDLLPVFRRDEKNEDWGDRPSKRPAQGEQDDRRKVAADDAPDDAPKPIPRDLR